MAAVWSGRRRGRVREERLPAVTSQAQPGNVSALRHGATSQRQIRPVARALRRRFLRQNRLRAGDLSGIQRGYLDSWAQCQAKVELIDRYLDQRGLIREDGELQPVMKLYVSLVNSARLSLGKLEASMLQRERGGKLADFVDAEYEELPE